MADKPLEPSSSKRGLNHKKEKKKSSKHLSTKEPSSSADSPNGNAAAVPATPKDSKEKSKAPSETASVAPDLPRLGQTYSFGPDECPISSCVVFLDRAEVTRVITLKGAQRGEQEVAVSGLPESITPESFRVSGTGNAVILEVAHELKPVMEEAKNVDEAKVKRLEELNLRVASLDAARKRLNEQTSWLDGFAKQQLQLTTVSPASDPGSPARPTRAALGLEDAARFMTFFGSQMAELDDALQKNSEEKKELQKEITELQVATRRVVPKKKGNKYEATISVNVFESADIVLRLSYVLSGGRWSPAYDVRAATKDLKVALTYNGTLINSTGEDWKGVQLTLSTARPYEGGSPPEIIRMMASLADPKAARWNSNSNSKNMSARKRNIAPSSAAMSNALFAPPPPRQTLAVRERRTSISYDAERSPVREEAYSESDGSGSDTDMPAPLMSTTVNEGSTACTFSVPRLADIPSDGRPHKLTIADVLLECKFTTTVVPEKSDKAYLRMIGRNKSPYPLLPGPLSVFVDNSFVCTSELKDTPPGGELELHLGTDPSVQVKFTVQGVTTETKGLISLTKKRTVEHKTKLTNNKSVPITVYIFEQLPKSNLKELVVTPLEPKEGDGPNNLPRTLTDKEKEKLTDKEKSKKSDTDPVWLTEANSVRWRIDLGAGETKTVPYSYSIEWPAAMDLVLSHG